MGMVPRGEVGILVAQIGLGLGVIGAGLYGVVLFMAVATTLVAPPLLKILFASERAAHDEVDSPDAGGIVTRVAPDDHVLVFLCRSALLTDAA